MVKKFNISVRQLYLLMVITAVSLIGLGIYGISDYKTLNDNTRTLYADRVVCVRELANIRFQYAQEIVPAALNVKNHLLTFDDALQRVRNARLIIDSNWHNYKLTYLTPEENVLAKQTDALKDRVDSDVKTLESILLKKDMAAIADLVKKQPPVVQTPFSLKLTQLIDLQERVSKQILENSGQTYTAASKNFALWIFISLLIALSLSFYIVKNIKRLINDILTGNDIITSSEHKYRSILENASDAIYLADNSGNFIDLSDSMCKMLGYSKEELLPINFSEIIDPDNLKITPIERPAIPNRPIFKERTFLTKDGKKVDVEINGQRVSKNILMGVARDVTERKRMELELREAELKFRTLVEKSIVGVYLSQNRKILYVNQRYSEIVGYEPQEIIDMGEKTIDNLFDKKNQDIIRASLQARDEGDLENIHYEVELIKKDGTLSYIEVYGTVIAINGQQTTLGTILDITDRKRTETKLAEAELKFRTLVEKSIVGVYIAQNEKFIYVNPRLAEIFGYTPDELLDLSDGPVEILFTEESRKLIRVNLQARYSGEIENVRYQVVGIRKDGATNHLEIHSNMVSIDGKPSLIGTILDITERKQAEEELKISERNLAAYNRDLTLLNTINDIILRNKNELELYREVCDCIVRAGGYKLAWVCHNPETFGGHTAVPIAAAGVTDYLKGVKVSLGDPELAKGPTATALRTGETRVTNDLSHATYYNPWLDVAKGFGIFASIAIGLDLGGGKKGALNIYSGYTNAFDKHEVAVLERLASNVSIAVQNIENSSILIESENRFRGAFEDSAIGMGLVSPEGKWLKVNRSLYEMLGYTEQELLSLTFQQITHPEDLESDLDLLYQTLRGEIDTYRMEKRYFHKDGSIIWINLNVSLVRGADKLPLYFVSQIENITEKVESQIKFQNLVENFIVGVYILQNGKLVYVNPRVLEESGYTSEELINMPFEQFIYKEDLELVQKMTQAREEGLTDAVRYEARIIKKDGLPLWCEMFGSSTVYNGAPALIGTLVNVSERKAVYDELKKSEANLRSIFDSTDVSYLLLDTAYNIISLNQQMRDIYRDNVGVILNEGENLIGLIVPERRESSRKIYDTVLLTKKPSGYNATFPGNGFTRHFAASVFPIIVGDEAIGICISTVDITAQKNALEKLEAANTDLLKKAKELEYSNTELEQFAYVASHDLQEPLRMVTSFLSQLEKKYGDMLDEKGKKYIYFATDGAKRMRQLILDLLEFSRVGRTEESLEDVDFNDLINEVLPLYRKNIEELKAKVHFEQLPVLHTFKTPIRQVLQNLIGNALKYYREGVAPVIVISSKENSTDWEFSVKDNGIGIDTEYFNQIFIIFKRLHNRDHYPGTGMGLAITKKIVENLGGRIWVESREGEGSVFYFTIPKKNI